MATQKILKVGNSLGISIPSSLVKDLSLKAGDNVRIDTNLNSTLTVTFVDSHQLSLGLSQKPSVKKI